MIVSGPHTEAVLKKLTEPELVYLQLLLKTEATFGSQITDLSKEIKDTQTYLTKLEADVGCVVSSKRLVLKLTKWMFKSVIA